MTIHVHPNVLAQYELWCSLLVCFTHGSDLCRRMDCIFGLWGFLLPSKGPSQPFPNLSKIFVGFISLLQSWSCHSHQRLGLGQGTWQIATFSPGGWSILSNHENCFLYRLLLKLHWLRANKRSKISTQTRLGPWVPLRVVHIVTFPRF